MQILITGFQRSGTTLLRRLIDLHPDVQIMIHEGRVLKNANNVRAIKEGLFIYDNKRIRVEVDVNKNWGEKIPWYNGSGNDALNYCRKWMILFGESARVIHIIRDVNDVVNSNLAFKPVKDKEAAIRSKCVGSVKNVRNYLKSNERYMEVTFEDLVAKPRITLKRVFRFCELNRSDAVVNKITSARRDKLKYFDRINPDRAFAHRRKA